jgi:hypothetical protein
MKDIRYGAGTMTALTRRQALIGAAASVAAAALPAAAQADFEFINIIVYDSIEDDIADAWWMCHGGQRPPFRVVRVNAELHWREFKEEMKADFGIDLQ